MHQAGNAADVADAAELHLLDLLLCGVGVFGGSEVVVLVIVAACAVDIHGIGAFAIRERAGGIVEAVGLILEGLLAGLGARVLEVLQQLVC